MTPKPPALHEPASPDAPTAPRETPASRNTLAGFIARFNTSLDALRDLVRILPPWLEERFSAAAEHSYINQLSYARAICQGDDSSVHQAFPADIQTALQVIKDEKLDLAKQAELLRSRGLPIKVTEDGRLGPDRDAIDVDKLLAGAKGLVRSVAQRSLLYESSLMALVSSAEWLVSRLMYTFYDKYPGAAGETEKVFSLSDLSKYENLLDARAALIEFRVEQQMRASFEDWVSFFRTKPHISMPYLERDQDGVSEIFKRRNLVVHNGGIVNRHYLSTVSETVSKGVKEGDRLPVDEKYLTTAIDLIEPNLVLIACELWQKWERASEERPTTLLAIAYESLRAERWVVAERLSKFMMDDKNTEESLRLVGQINYWQSLKWQGRYEEIRTAVENADFSAKQPRFQLARYVICDDFNHFFALLPDVIRNGGLTVDNLREWPLFRSVREQPQFRECLPMEAVIP